MPIARLPQPYGLRIEMIRAGGFSDQELLKLVGSGTEKTLKEQVNSEIGWAGFLDYAQEDWITISTAVRSGYRFKFLTIGGLKDLLSIRHGKEEGKDYVYDGTRISGLKLNPSEYSRLEAILPANWSLAKELPQADDSGPVAVSISHSGSKAS